MNNQTYTRADYAAAMQYLAKMESSPGRWTSEEVAVSRILRNLPEPAPATFTDLTEEERTDYWGCAVKHKVHGWEGWALGYAAGYVNVLDKEWLRTGRWLPKDTTLLPNEPRLDIPGYTPEPKPDHPTTLTTEEDYKGAPEGTVVADEIAVYLKSGGLWYEPGNTGVSRDIQMATSPSTVLRWGDGQ